MVLRLLRADLKRAFGNGRFPLCVLGIAAVLFSAALYRLKASGTVYAVYQAARMASGSDILTVAVLPVLPYSVSFASDLSARAYPFWCVRCGAARWCRSRLITALVSAWLTCFLGYWLFVAVLLPFRPITGTVGGSGPYGVYLQSGKQAMFFLFEFSHIAFSASLCAVAAVLASALIPSSFAAASIPAALYLAAQAVSQNLHIPAAVSLAAVLAGRYSAGTPLSSLAVKAANVLVRCILAGAVAVRLMRKRVQR